MLFSSNSAQNQITQYAPAVNPDVNSKAAPSGAIGGSGAGESYSPNLIDIYITREGAHVVGGGGCNSGYKQVGSFADCGGGRCFGNQLLCAKYLTDSQKVTDFYITRENAHIVSGPACNSGYEKSGSIADCGNARCYGNQLLCVKKSTSSSGIKDVRMTAEGTHVVGGIACTYNYVKIGSAADCGSGRCFGNQNVCAQKV